MRILLIAAVLALAISPEVIQAERSVRQNVNNDVYKETLSKEEIERKLYKLTNDLKKNYLIIDSLKNYNKTWDEEILRSAITDFLMDFRKIGHLTHRNIERNIYFQLLTAKTQKATMDLASVKHDIKYLVGNYELNPTKYFVQMILTSLKWISKKLTQLLKSDVNSKIMPARLEAAQRYLKATVYEMLVLSDLINVEFLDDWMQKLKRVLNSVETNDDIQAAKDAVDTIIQIADKHYKMFVEDSGLKIDTKLKTFSQEELDTTLELLWASAKLLTVAITSPRVPEAKQLKFSKDLAAKSSPLLKKLARLSGIPSLEIFGNRINMIQNKLRDKKGVFKIAMLLLGGAEKVWHKYYGLEGSADYIAIFKKLEYFLQRSIEMLEYFHVGEVDNPGIDWEINNYLIFIQAVLEIAWKLGERYHVKGWDKFNNMLQDAAFTLYNSGEQLTAEKVNKQMKKVSSAIKKFINQNNFDSADTNSKKF